MKRKWTILYIILFFCICTIPTAGYLIAGAEGDFEENFGLRKELITANSQILAKIFQTSSDDGVIVGEQGWLYYKDSLEDYQGMKNMSERQLFDAAHTLSMIQEYVESKGLAFAFAIAPNKNSLYGEDMPYYYRGFREQENNRVSLIPYLEEEGIHYADLYEEFSKQDKVLYHKQDSHWNNEGAALAADSILSCLDKEHSSYSNAKTYIEKDFEGDLAAMLYPAAVPKEDEVYYEKKPDFTYIQEVESNFDPKIYTESAKGKGSLVMYRDSFGNALLPFMAEAYEQAYFSRAVPYQLSDIFSCHADTLVIERAERFIPELAENAPVLPASIENGRLWDDEIFTEEIQDLEVVNQGVYTKIKGTIPNELLEVKSRILIRVNGLVSYEAFPVCADGQEGFECYLITKTLKEDNTFELGIVSE